MLLLITAFCAVVPARAWLWNNNILSYIFRPRDESIVHNNSYDVAVLPRIRYPGRPRPKTNKHFSQPERKISRPPRPANRASRFTKIDKTYRAICQYTRAKSLQQ